MWVSTKRLEPWISLIAGTVAEFSRDSVGFIGLYLRLKDGTGTQKSSLSYSLNSLKVVI